MKANPASTSIVCDICFFLENFKYTLDIPLDILRVLIQHISYICYEMISFCTFLMHPFYVGQVCIYCPKFKNIHCFPYTHTYIDFHDDPFVIC